MSGEVIAANKVRSLRGEWKDSDGLLPPLLSRPDAHVTRFHFFHRSVPLTVSIPGNHAEFVRPVLVAAVGGVETTAVVAQLYAQRGQVQRSGERRLAVDPSVPRVLYCSASIL